MLSRKAHSTILLKWQEKAKISDKMKYHDLFAFHRETEALHKKCTVLCTCKRQPFASASQKIQKKLKAVIKAKWSFNELVNIYTTFRKGNKNFETEI